MARAARRRGPLASVTIFGEPARIMAPRILLLTATVVLTGFGILMIYSASSVTALSSAASNYDATYYLVRQAAFAGVSAIVAYALSFVDYRHWTGVHLWLLWGAVVALLALVRVFGRETLGATRWIAVGPFTLQPSELAKPVLVLIAADLLARFQEGEIETFGALMWRGLLLVGLPVAMILFQPDKGTTLIIGATLVVMLYLAGVRGVWILVAFLAIGVVGGCYAMTQDYSRQRIMAMLDPVSSADNDSYQLVQGWYAFGSGGLTGLGIGMSRQKYGYLPMAYNDFIFAVVGEELGLLGTLFVVALFLLLLWAGLRIAQQAPDLRGQLVAGGATAVFGIQALLNVCGVLGLFPLSGKPLPFLSYGGSSILSCMLLVGLILSVSRRSRLPETEYDRRRGMLRVVGPDPSADFAADDDRYDVGLSRAGEATPRSWRSGVQAGGTASRGDVRPSPSGGGVGGAGGWSPRSLELVSGRSARDRADRGPQPASEARSGSRRGGYKRTDLSGDPADRLWKHEGTQGRDQRSPRGGRYSRDR